MLSVRIAFVIIFFSIVSAHGNDTEVGASHNCAKNLRHSHIWNTVLFIFCVILVLTNVSTIAWVARDSIRDGVARLADRLRRHDDQGAHSLLAPDN